MRTKITELLGWLKSATDQDVIRTGTSRGYLRLIGYGHKTASPEMAAAIEAVTAGLVSRQTLRPDDWKKIWPELLAA